MKGAIFDFGGFGEVGDFGWLGVGGWCEIAIFGGFGLCRV